MIKLPRRSPLFAVIVSFFATSAAHSADLAVPPLAPVADFSGWCLRGDIGFSNQRVGSLSNENYTRFDSVTNVDKGFDAAPLFGLGIGYNVNSWLRFDVTGGYRRKARVSNGMTLELAYRYIDLGKAVSGPMVDYTFASIDTPFEFNRLTSHDLKLGLRYNFGAYDYAPPPPPPLRNKS